MACNPVNQLTYKIDFEASTSLRNYISELELECSTDAQVKWSGSFHFIGVIVSLVFWIKSTDMFGRKTIVLIGATL